MLIKYGLPKIFKNSCFNKCNNLHKHIHLHARTRLLNRHSGMLCTYSVILRLPETLKILLILHSVSETVFLTLLDCGKYSCFEGGFHFGEQLSNLGLNLPHKLKETESKTRFIHWIIQQMLRWMLYHVKLASALGVLASRGKDEHVHK